MTLTYLLFSYFLYFLEKHLEDLRFCDVFSQAKWNSSTLRKAAATMGKLELRRDESEGFSPFFLSFSGGRGREGERER